MLPENVCNFTQAAYLLAQEHAPVAELIRKHAVRGAYLPGKVTHITGSTYLVKVGDATLGGSPALNEFYDEPFCNPSIGDDVLIVPLLYHESSCHIYGMIIAPQKNDIYRK